MFLSIKRQFLIPAFIALVVVVIFDTQSVHCLDLDGHQTTPDNETSQIKQVRGLKSEKSSKGDRKKSESEKDYSGSKGDKSSKKSKSEDYVKEDGPRGKLDEKREMIATTSASYANLRGSSASSSDDEDDSNVPVEEGMEVEDDTLISGRTGDVVRPSTILGRDPTLQPSPAPGGNDSIVRPGSSSGSSYYAEDTPAPVFVANTQNAIARPGGSSSTSFVYPTAAPTYAPVNQQPAGIPISYIPRPGSTSSWDGSQSYQADKPTPMPTPYPTTFPPVYVSAVNVPVARPGSLLLPESPSHSPSDFPSVAPSGAPSSTPTLNPTPVPTLRPTKAPTPKPSKRPTRKPTDPPTWSPTDFPTMSPEPTPAPSREPTKSPTKSPTVKPSASPSDVPSGKPSTRAGTLVRPSQSGSTASYFTKRPTVSPTTAGTVDVADNATVTDDDDDDDTMEEMPSTSSPSIAPISSTTMSDGNVTRSTSAPSSSSVSQNDAQVAAPTSVPQNDAQVPRPTSVPQNDAQEARPTFPTWQPTTWLPTVTFHPTKFIDWSLIGRKEDSNATSDVEYDEGVDDSNTTSNDEDYDDDGCCGRWGGDIEACSINPICNTNQDRCEILPQCSGNWLSNSDDEPQNSD
jgi:hypothetical protein